MMLSTSLILALASGLASEPPTIDTPPVPTAAEYDGASLQLDVFDARVPSADITIDGRLDDAAWSSAARLSGFTQYEPVEGVSASQVTDVRVLVTDEAILFGVRAFDDEPGGVRSSLTERDSFERSDDFIRFVLDTFNDNRRAYVFSVNPLGVQSDGLWIEGRGGRGGPIDRNPDFLWESAGRVDQEGYTVEVKIPLKSLRFPELPVQDWGLQVSRQIQRNGFSESWAPITREAANQLEQFGALRGLRDLDPGRFMEFNPVLTASRVGSYQNDVGGLAHDPASSDFGFNATYGLTSNLTLDGTVNPDFSQIEADAGQITVNERFAIYLPEKRPFFLEGTDVFSMPKNLVYTRSIANPVGAVKLSGKVGSTRVAYIGAVDRMGGSSDPAVNLVRAQQDVGSNSTIGAVYTDRTAAGDEFNRVFGVDGRFVLARRYTVTVQAASSADSRPGTATEWGSLLTARFSRSGRSFSASASFEDISSDFRARSGFIRRVGNTELSARTGYTWRGGRGALVESFGPFVEVQGFWKREDFWGGRAPLESELQLGLSASFRNNIGGFLTYSRDDYNYARGDYEGLFSGVSPVDAAAFAPSQALFSGLQSVRLRSWISPWERIRVSLGASWSETPIFERTTGTPADLADSWSGDVRVTFRPSGRFSAEVGGRHVTLLRKRDGSTYSSATIPRLQARYQFSRALFTRVIGEYSSQERGAVLDPSTGQPLYVCSEDCRGLEGSDRYDFRVEALLGYEPSPGTVFFVGYSRDWRDTQSFRFRDITSRSEGLFVKLSYRYRM